MKSLLIVSAALAAALLAHPAEARTHKHRVIATPQPCFFICTQEVTRPVQRVRRAKSPHQRKLARRGKYLQERLPIGGPTYVSGGGGLIAKARSYMGETARQIGLNRYTQWCSAFLRRIAGTAGVDDRAISWLRRPRVPKEVGAIAVMAHHVGIVTGFDGHGNPIIVSGNHGRRVGEGIYAARRIIAYVSA